MNLEIEWLKSQWGLPKANIPAVEKLFEAHEKGSTACLVESGLVNWGKAAANPDGNAETPLVIVGQEGGTYVQTRWFFEAEKQIAARLHQLVTAPAGNIQADFLIKYFPEPGEQREAAVLALSRNLAIITGGPGTGKTYTLARILATLLETRNLDPRQIQLAAPTGKASDRMREAVAQSSSGLPEDLRSKLHAAAASSRTIHALLGHHTGRNSCAFNAERPLPIEILIVDECSMVDTLLWRALMEALPIGCKLILLGDPNQLESVGRGNVFAEMAVSPSLAGARIHLTKSRRFADRPAIARLALTIEHRNPGETLEILSQNQDPGCPKGLFWSRTTSFPQILENLPTAALDAMQAVAFATTPEEALQALGKIRILTSHRSPAFATDSPATLAEELLSQKYPGRKIINRPVIINRNDPETGLRNGEVGVVHASEPATQRVFFENRKEGIPLSKLPDHSPAWGITIHRSQGSEYDNVIAILPRNAESPLATRELLYTAITRAKRNLAVFGPAEVVEKAVSKTARRTTLLEFHLAKNSPPEI